MPCDMSKYTRAFIRGKNKVAQNEIQKKTCGFSYSKYMANLEAFHWVISSSINLLFLRVEKIHSNLIFVRKTFYSTSVSKFQWQVCSNKLQTSQVGGKKIQSNYISWIWTTEEKKFASRFEEETRRHSFNSPMDLASPISKIGYRQNAHLLHKNTILSK